MAKALSLAETLRGDTPVTRPPGTERFEAPRSAPARPPEAHEPAFVVTYATADAGYGERL